MMAHRLTAILNVSDMQASFEWFEKFGWTKGWDWGSPPTFGGVCSGECEIFLCLDGQGGHADPREEPKRQEGGEGFAEIVQTVLTMRSSK